MLDPAATDRLLAVVLGQHSMPDDMIDGACLHSFGPLLAPPDQCRHLCDRRDGHTGRHVCGCGEWTASSANGLSDELDALAAGILSDHRGPVVATVTFATLSIAWALIWCVWTWRLWERR